MRTSIKAVVFLTILITFLGQNLAYGNNAPVFTEGARTARSVAENTPASTNIGAAISATDPDSDDTLTYSLHRGDRDAFQIDPNTGQLQTKAALDYETKSSYTDLAVRVTDSSGITDAILVTINVTDVTENNAPVFTEGARTARSVAENTPASTNIGAAISATDPDSGDTLTYSLHRGDRDAFQIDPNTGQLQTKAALDYETKSSYTDLAVRVTDSSGITDAILITINVKDVAENNAPVFTAGDSTTRTIAENTVAGENIGMVVAATDVDANTTLTYTLGGTDAASFSIVSTTGQLQTRAALDYETKKSYSVRVSVSDSNNDSDSILVTINVSNVNETPNFTEGSSITRSIAENTESRVRIGTPIVATDVDSDPLTYSLSGPDAAAFTIGRNSGRLKTKTALDYETKAAYTVTVTAADGNGGTASITVIVNVTNVNDTPVFTEGSSTTRFIAENTASGTNIGAPIIATDPDGDTIRYRLGGVDASAFTIDSTTGQLQIKKVPDYETQLTTYIFFVTAFDGYNRSSTTVAVYIQNVDEPGDPESPGRTTGFAFKEGNNTTRSIPENAASGTNIGAPVVAPDTGATTYRFGRSPDTAYFTVDANTGQLQTKAPLNYGKRSTYMVVVAATDGNGNIANIRVRIDVTQVFEEFINVAPVFTDGSSTTRSVAENTASSTNIGSAVAATDADGDGITYSLGGTDAGSFSIDSGTGQLQTNAALDYEEKSTYTVTVTVDDGWGGGASIAVTINVADVNEAPVFTEGSSTTRQVPVGSPINTHVGSPVSATDPEGGTTTYSLGGTDADKFNIDSSTGQIKVAAKLIPRTIPLQVGQVPLQFVVTITATDDTVTDTIEVTITGTHPQQAPASQRAPTKTVLLPNYPNPFNPETWIPYQLSKSAQVTLTVYNVKGEVVRQFALGHQSAGSYRSKSRSIHWDGRNQSGEKVATGVYFYQFTAGSFTATRRMLIIK